MKNNYSKHQNRDERVSQSSQIIGVVLRYSYRHSQLNKASGKPALVEYNGVKYGYLQNLQGDIVGIVDSAGNEVVKYIYDPWGKILSTSGSLASTLGIIQPFRYRGYVYDEETGLYYLRSRYYNPSYDRFINIDALLQVKSLIGNNVYSYCQNNSVHMKDSSGAARFDCFSNGLPYDAEEYGLPEYVLAAIYLLTKDQTAYAYSQKIDGKYKYGIYAGENTIHVCCAYVLTGLLGGYKHVEGRYDHAKGVKKLNTLDQLEPGMEIYQVTEKKGKRIYEHIGLVMMYDFGDGLELAVFQSTSASNLGDKGYIALFPNDENAGPNIVALRDIGNWTHFGTPKYDYSSSFFMNPQNKWCLFN